MTTFNLPRESTMQGIEAQLKIIAEAQKAIASATAIDAMDWYGIAKLVYGGNAASSLPVGTALSTIQGDYKYQWDVVHHGTVNGKPAMFLLMHNTLGNMQYDATEALYYAETQLSAGTYNFTLLSGYDTTYGGGKTLQFTLTQPVPAGGVIMFPWGWQQQSTSTKISTYSSRTSTTAIETVSVTEGSGGTNLGTADGKSNNMNHSHRIRYGSNNVKESGLRQWLNSAATKGNFWTPQTKFDRPPSYANTLDGFLTTLPDDFKAVVKKRDRKVNTNSVFELNDTINSYYTLSDKFWLASRFNVYGSEEVSSVATDDVFFDYYNGASNTDRIKYDSSGVARWWWLDTPHAGTACYVRRVNTDGSLDNGDAVSGGGVAPACVIY